MGSSPHMVSIWLLAAQAGASADACAFVESTRMLVALNEAGQQPAMNLSLARVYLRHSDPLVSTRTWQHVMDEIIRTRTGENQNRKAVEMILILLAQARPVMKAVRDHKS
jgi:hypothetical protein